MYDLITPSKPIYNATLIYNQESKFKTDFYGKMIRRSEDKSWYVFPWEEWWNFKFLWLLKTNVIDVCFIYWKSQSFSGLVRADKKGNNDAKVATSAKPLVIIYRKLKKNCLLLTLLVFFHNLESTEIEDTLVL